MKFKTKLWNQVTSGNGFYFRKGSITIYYIISGKYMGLWKFCNNKTRFILVDPSEDVDTHNPAGKFSSKSRVLCVPHSLVQALCFTKDSTDKLLFKDPAFKKLLIAWKGFQTRNKWKIDYLNSLSGVSKWILCYTGKVVKERDFCDPHNLDTKLGNVFKSFGLQKRWSLINNILNYGIKTGFKKSFRGLKPRYLNSLIKDSFRWTPQYIQRKRDWNVALETVYRVNKDHVGLTEEELFYVLSKNKNYHSPMNYFREYARLQTIKQREPEWPVIIPPRLKLKENPELYHIHHDRIINLTGEYWDWYSKCVKRPEYWTNVEEKRRDFWLNIIKDSGRDKILQPLVTELDYTQEHHKMHHCINAYYMSTELYCAHIQLGDEAATIAVFNDKRIQQLYGPCNQPVSASLRLVVESIGFKLN